jgi:transposase
LLEGLTLLVIMLFLCGYIRFEGYMPANPNKKVPSGRNDLPTIAETKRWSSNCKFETSFIGLIQDLGRQGYSVAEMAAACDVSECTFDRWKEDFPEFGCALKKAKTLSKSWWKEKGRTNLEYIDAKGVKQLRTDLYKFELTTEHGVIDKPQTVEINLNKDSTEALMNKVKEIRGNEL